ncbi:hypothetical protein L1987_12759 [Smallanthus sonchifolius]|uniref:Uncharacterized protein n=1 Tax=Smallanthus sonchifolius TaxID=185202 RepID=A0ACB9JI54_9ASTR|nr:hypothetical protein L1987_12759 [Smallanthus sonchifolius]
MNQSSDYKRVFDHFIEEVQIVIDSLQGSDRQLGFEGFISLMESEKEEEKLEDLKKAFRMYEMDETDCIIPMSLNRMLRRLGESTNVDECVGMICRNYGFM